MLGRIVQEGEVFAHLLSVPCQLLVTSNQACVVILSDGVVVRKFFKRGRDGKPRYGVDKKG